MTTNPSLTFDFSNSPPENLVFFELMEQPQEFEIDAQSLSKRFKNLQRVLHPDKFSNKDPEDQKNAENWSALVNEAYSTLLDPMKRALYLLGTFMNHVDTKCFKIMV